MDIQQLRSSIFELYEPLENDRQYIVFDAARGNLIVDVPRYSERAVRLIRGTGPASPPVREDDELIAEDSSSARDLSPDPTGRPCQLVICD